MCTFSGGGHLFDYSMMDTMVALTSAYKAEGKVIEFHMLRSLSVKMLKKADFWTKEVQYTEDNLTEHKGLERVNFADAPTVVAMGGIDDPAVPKTEPTPAAAAERA